MKDSVMVVFFPPGLPLVTLRHDAFTREAIILTKTTKKTKPDSLNWIRSCAVLPTTIYVFSFLVPIGPQNICLFHIIFFLQFPQLFIRFFSVIKLFFFQFVIETQSHICGKLFPESCSKKKIKFPVLICKRKLYSQEIFFTGIEC